MVKKYAPDLLYLHKNFAIEEHTYFPGESTNEAHYHKHYEILYMTKGKRDLYMNDKTYTIDQNSVMLIPPYSLHRSVYGNHSDSQERIMINFKPDFILEFVQELNFRILDCFSASSPIMNLDEVTAKRISSIIKDMHKHYAPDNPLEMQLQLIRLLNILYRNHHKNGEQHSTKMQAIVEYVALHHEENITLTFLEEKFGINKYQISRLFPKHAGMGMIKYLNHVRLIHAKKLLKSGKYKITYIATKVGFENVTHFNRVFKSVKNCSPKEYLSKLNQNHKQ